MARTNISLNVTDEMLETLINPLKKDGRLNRILNTLLEGYRTEEYIRAYVDGDLEHMVEKDADDFLAKMAKAQESLSDAQMYNLEAENIASASKMRHETIVNEGVDGSESTTEAGNNDLADQVAELNRKMNSLIEAISNGGLRVEVPEEVVVPFEARVSQEPEILTEPVLVSASILTESVDNSPEPVDNDDDDEALDYVTQDYDDEDFMEMTTESTEEFSSFDDEEPVETSKAERFKRLTGSTNVKGL